MSAPTINICTLLTPPGAAAVAVVRLSGPETLEFLRRHFSRMPRAGRCVHGDITDGEKIIDDAVVVVGHDGTWADINLHGGPWVVRSFMGLAARGRFASDDRPAIPLPHSAVDGTSFIEREMLASLPSAKTELSLRALLNQPAAWAAVGELDAARIRGILEDRSLWWLLHPPRVAMVGAANVGKSTLANRLFAQELAITADLPGTTRDWVGETANINGLAVTLVDTPGIRATDDEIERRAIARSGEQVRAADLVVVVLDPTLPLQPDQAAILAAYPRGIIVINKSDQPAVWDISEVPHALRTVGTTGEGVPELVDAVYQEFIRSEIESSSPMWWTRRQMKALESAIDAPEIFPAKFMEGKERV